MAKMAEKGKKRSAEDEKCFANPFPKAPRQPTSKYLVIIILVIPSLDIMWCNCCLQMSSELEMKLKRAISANLQQLGDKVNNDDQSVYTGAAGVSFINVFCIGYNNYCVYMYVCMISCRNCFAVHACGFPS